MSLAPHSRTSSRHTRLRALLFVAVCASLCWGSPVNAQDDLDDMLRDGDRALEQENFVEAKARFLQAFEAYPNARALAGAGQAAAELGENVEAYGLLQRAIAQNERALLPSDQDRVESLLLELDGLLSFLTVTTRPDDAAVLVNLVDPARLSDGTIVLSPGEHRIAASADGFVPREETVTLEGGERRELSLTLFIDGPMTRLPPLDREMDGLSLGLILSGGGLLGGAGVAVWWGLNRNSELADCEASSTSCFRQSALRSQRLGGFVAAGILGLGGMTALIAGFIRFKRSNGRGRPIEELQLESGVSCGPAGLGAVCVGRF